MCTPQTPFLHYCRVCALAVRKALKCFRLSVPQVRAATICCAVAAGQKDPGHTFFFVPTTRGSRLLLSPRCGALQKHEIALLETLNLFLLSAQVRAAAFFLGYRRVALAPHEVLLAVSVPFTRRHEYVREFKQAHRRDDDIAIVNAGMRARMRRTLAGAHVSYQHVRYQLLEQCVECARRRRRCHKQQCNSQAVCRMLPEDSPLKNQ